MEVSINAAAPNSWMVYLREHPTKMDDDWGYPYDSGNTSFEEDWSVDFRLAYFQDKDWCFTCPCPWVLRHMLLLTATFQGQSTWQSLNKLCCFLQVNIWHLYDQRKSNHKQLGMKLKSHSYPENSDELWMVSYCISHYGLWMIGSNDPNPSGLDCKLHHFLRPLTTYSRSFESTGLSRCDGWPQTLSSWTLLHSTKVFNINGRMYWNEAKLISLRRYHAAGV